MKLLGIISAVLVATMLLGCGGGNGSTSNPANGTWSATLDTSSGEQLGSFTFDMTQNNTQLSGSNMNFANMGSLSQCFGAGTMMNGQMGPGMMNGGTMSMTMSWTQSGLTNTLTMQGNMAQGMVSGSGTFSLTAQTSGCVSQSGDFTMMHTGNMMR